MKKIEIRIYKRAEGYELEVPHTAVDNEVYCFTTLNEAINKSVEVLKRFEQVDEIDRTTENV